MKLISWNVNGLRACLTHGFAESFAALDADIFSVQETKMQPGQADFAPEGYTEYTYSAEKKGYSGTACWCKTAPLAVTTGIGLEQHDHEGRVLTLEYPGFYLVNCYTPNSQDGLKPSSLARSLSVMIQPVWFWVTTFSMEPVLRVYSRKA
jgi:exodeoxyribonuclease-3